MLDKPETIQFYRKRLPHWEVAEGRYFVTIRLKGAIPDAGLERIRRLRVQVDTAIENGQDGLEERRAIFREMEHWLDHTDKVKHLTDPAVAEMVKEAIVFREKNETWEMFAYTLMPNHIHMFFKLGGRYKEAGAVGRLTDWFPDGAASSKQHLPFANVRSSRWLDEPATIQGVPGSSSQALPLSRERLNLESVLEDFKRWTATQAATILLIDGTHFWQREWFDHWSRSPDEDEGIERYIRNNPVTAGLVKKSDEWLHTGYKQGRSVG